METLQAGGQLSVRDVTRSYEGAFLSFYTALERQIERLFMGILMNRLSVSPPRAASLVSIPSDAVARRVVAGGRSYADWLPIRFAEGRADVFLASGRPFDRLLKVDKEVLERMSLIRNAVAHKSHHATRRFHKELIDGKGIPSNQRTPAGYLRGQHATGQTRLNFFMAQGVQALERLCA